MRRLLLTLLFLLFLLPASAHAEVPLTGNFTVSLACPATLSISKQTNPGKFMVAPGQAYQVLAANKSPPTHFRLAIPGAPEPRWVAVDCGHLDGRPTSTLPTPEQPAAPTPGHARPGKSYLLAVSWEPAFCEVKPDKPECRTLGPDRYDATHFALHGLWPQPRDNEFCGVSAADIANSETNWRALLQVDLSTGLRTRLDRVMPGTRSQLDRHEWTRHGTCYGTTAERYFSDAVDLMDQLNGSAVATLFADNIGRTLTLRSIRQAFDTAFGAGAGERVRMACEPDGNRQIITELAIGLTGTINGPDDFATLLAAASPTDSSCTSGMVDPVGLR